jgi:hypothetical protein
VHDALRLAHRQPLEQDAFTTLKIALLAPMPSASVSTAAAVKPGRARRPRRP